MPGFVRVDAKMKKRTHGGLGKMTIGLTPGITGTMAIGRLVNVRNEPKCAGKAGEVQRMRESYDQDPASQVGPESCGDGREAVVEALTGERAGRVSNRETVNVRGADACLGVRKATSLVSTSQETGGPREVEDPEARLRALRCTHRSISHGSREISRLANGESPAARVVNPSPRSKTTMNDEREKSDRPVVPGKSTNKRRGYWSFFAEWMKGRGLAKENSGPAKQADRTPSRVGKGDAAVTADADPEGLSNALERIRAAARRDKGLKFTSLWHHVYDIERLREAYYALKRDAATGVDEVTWQEYGQTLENHLADLSERLARGAYRAKPVKRAYVPKADGNRRPIGIPALEDKLVQRATVQVLNAIYDETDFLGFSYGFRPGRSCHMALDALAVGIETKKVNWMLDADIKSFFDTLSHEWLIKFVEHRIGDHRVVRHVRKWLNAGVMMEDGRHEQQDEGTPQGGSISPLLANLYLHYVLDLWAEQWRRTQTRGDVIIVRYADDFVVGFEHESDAQRFLADLRERFRQFNLELHAAKTRVIEFGRHARENRERRGQRGKPMSFNFLGFTHVCDQTRRGRFTVLRRTMAKRMRIKLASIKAELWRRLHDSISEVGRWLASVLRGHYRYFGVPRNFRALSSFLYVVRRLWHRTLNRRCQSRRVGMTTEARMSRIARRWLPMPRICHPYPSERLCVLIQGKSPVR